MANSAFEHSPSITVPGSSTNTALVRWSGTGADTFTDSTIIVGATTMGLAADTDLLTFGNGTLAITGAVTGITSLTVDNININGNTISTSGSELYLQNSSEEWWISSTRSFQPGSTNLADIGRTAGSLYPRSIYLGTSVIFPSTGKIETTTGVLTLDSGAAINIEPAAGSAVLIDGNVSIDGDAVTGIATLTASGVITAGGFTIGSAAITEAELEILDGATVTTTELNLLDALDRGSILYGNNSGVTTVLGQGTTDQVLTSDGTDISWEDAGGGDFSNGGDNGALVLGTNDSNSLTLETNNTARMVLSAAGDVTVNTGNVVIGTSGKGIDFTANTADATALNISSEVLDDYEEGTWTPRLGDNSMNTSGEGEGYNSANGDYVKIGRVVYITFRMGMDGLGSLDTGHHARILGLPFTERGSSGVDGAQIIINPQANGGLNITAGHSVSGSVTAANARINLQVWDATTGNTSMFISEISADGWISGTGHYFALT